MYLRKKQGVIMLEVLILLNLLMILIVYNSKAIVANSSKYELYEIKEDILSITEEEYKLLCEVKNELKSNKELENNIIFYKDDLSINYKYIFSENSNLIFAIENGNAFIKEDLGKKIEQLRIIDIFKIKEENYEDIVLKPNQYKIYYMRS